MSLPIIAKRYKAIALLGKGGMGEVFQAQDTVLDIIVAIKVLPASMVDFGAARLQREAIALAKLNHPNIAKVIDFAQTEDQSPYMVMEYLEGDSLDKIIKDKGKIVTINRPQNFSGDVFRGIEKSNIESIIIESAKVDQNCVNSLLACKSIYCLKFNECNLHNDAFASFGKFAHLKNLHIMNINGISNQMIKDICKSQVNELNFKKSDLNEAQALRLASIKSLDRLTIQDCNVSEKTLQQIAADYKKFFRKELEVND